MASEKFRLRFSKLGPLRLLSHHDMMRCLERMLRRAELPFRSTQGFHPGPRIVFALPLPLGVEGKDDVLEIELLKPFECDDVLQRMNSSAPEGLRFLSVTEVEMRKTAKVVRALYSLSFPFEVAVEVQQKANELMELDKVWVTRMHPTPRRTNIRPYLRAITVEPERVLIDLWVTGQGTARGDELVKLLGLSDAVSAGHILTRDTLVLQDETTPNHEFDVPPVDGPEIEHLNHVAGTPADETNDASRAVWGLSPHGPLVE